MIASTIFNIPAGETFQSFAQLKNILVVITDKNRYMLLWSSDDQSYTELEDVPIPLFDFRENIKYTELQSNEIQEGNAYPDPDVTASIEFSDIVDLNETLKDTLKSFINSYKDDHVITDMVLIRFAYKLFDGSYIKQSKPFYLRATDLDNGIYINIRTDEVSGTDKPLYWSWKNISFGNINFAYFLSLEDTATLLKYKGIIKSLDIFMTESVEYKDVYSNFYIQTEDPGKEWETNPNWNSSPAIPETFTPPKNNTGEISLREESLYYKIHEIDLLDLVNTPQPTSLTEITLDNLDTLKSEQILPVDEFSHHTIWGTKDYNYNSRIHFGDIRNKFSKGFYPFNWRFDFDGISAQTYRVKTFIRTDDGDKIVYNEIDVPIMENGHSELLGEDAVILIPAILVSYPDARAYKMQMQRKNVADDKFYVADEPSVWENFPLKSHPTLNYSYFDGFINANLGYDGQYPIILYPIEVRYETSPDFYLPLDTLDDEAEKNILVDENRVQLSKVDNPIVYPAENSYRVGNPTETVIGFGTVVEALSVGQFGQFPLYVFTTAGIFVMEQGSGTIEYARVSSLSKEICNNPASIKSIGGGVVFATDKALNIISGSQISEVSKLVRGVPEGHLVNNDTFKQYLNDPNFVTLLTELSTVDFLEYLEDSIIAYDHVKKEIIVHNSTYTFSYVYNILNSTWHKVLDIYDQFVSYIPDTLGYRDYILYDLHIESSEFVETLFITRPIKYGTLNRKSIERLVLRADILVKDLTYSGLYLYGSIDGKKYIFLRGKTPQDHSDFNDILIKRTHANFKYLIVVFAGQIKDSSINFMETTYFDRWAKKLR